MPISDDIRKISVKIQLLIISVVLMKGHSEFVISYMGKWVGRGPGASPAQFPQILALQSSPKSRVIQLAVHDYDFLHQDHSAYSNDFTTSDCYLF